MKFSIITLGCKVNSYESDCIKEKFNAANYTFVKLDDAPDIIIINTCSVTNQSDAKSRHMIRLARRKSPNAIIVACGCSVQNHQDSLKEIGADILLGNKDKSKILDYVEEFAKKREYISKFYDMSNVEFESMILKNENDKTRAFVKIQDGCNNFCSYCIIPYLRGNIRSKDFEKTIEEINSLAENGHKEVVLTGIHTGSYGTGTEHDLTDLIHEISKNENLHRIRISSIEVTELNDKFLKELENNPKICDHLHIPLQAGSDHILKLMNRKYITSYYKEKIESIRKIRPNISITTDLIVGFPGETDDDFNNTIELLKEISFTKIHTFPFSLRSGTKAEEFMKDAVDEKIKKERVKRVLELSNILENSYYKKFIGKKISIIVEKNDNGYSSNYIKVLLNEERKEGELVNVEITNVDGLKVEGTVLNN